MIYKMAGDDIPSPPSPGELIESTTLSDRVGEMLSGIPTPLKKNAWKAIDRLCAAAIEVPAAYLEGKAAEKRAETEARVKIIEASADKIASQLDVDPSYAKAAVKKFDQKIIREQVNVDSIVQMATKQIAEEAEVKETDKEAKPIDNDWLSQFEEEACKRTSEQMQELFAKVLAGEIKQPSTFSIKSIRILGNMDQRAATLFQNFCSLSVSLKIANIILDKRVVSMGNAGNNSLQKYGFGFGSLNVLQEHGLIISDYNSYYDYQASIIEDAHVALPFAFMNNYWGFMLKNNKPKNEIRVHGVALSESGKELSQIVSTKNDNNYAADLTAYFNSQNLDIKPVLVR